MTGEDRREAIVRRHEQVLGQGPRILPDDRASVAEEVQATTQRLRGAVGKDAPPLPLEVIPEIMFTMRRFPMLWNRLIDLTLELQGENARLPLRDRKLAILRTGWLCAAPYEFGEHVAQSRRAGLTQDEVERVTAGSAAEGWTDHERAVLRAVEELHADAMVSDATWDELAKAYDEHQLVELLVLIGQFTATAYFQNSLRLRLEKGNEGLLAR